MKNSNRSILGILFLVFIFFVILMIFASYTLKSFKGESAFNLGNSNGQGKDKIAVIEINGVIMQAKEVVELLNKANKDKKVKAIIMRVNSPGGAVGPSQEIYQEMLRIDMDEENGKPVYASLGSVAASGGYYVASAAREIFSNPGTVTGSIGVIMKFMNLSKLYEWAMVKPVNIKAGKYKTIGDPGRDMTPEEQEIMENMISGVHQQFIKHIMHRRAKKVKGKIEELAQGQIFSGEQAHGYGLVDHLGGLWGAHRVIEKSLGLTDSKLVFFKKKKPSGIWKIIDNIDEASMLLKNFLQININENNGHAGILQYR